MTKIKDMVKHKKRVMVVEADPVPGHPLIGTKHLVTLRVPVLPAKPEVPKKKQKPPTELQKLASKRSWDILQVQGSINHLEKLRSSLAGGHAFQYVYERGLQVIKDELIQAINKKWEEDKLAYHRRIEEEAFAAYPRSFRGSPEQINKRLEIMKAQEEF